MSRQRRPARTSFFGGDGYARVALGRVHEIGNSFADGDIHVAQRGLSESVIPDIDEEVLVVESADPQVAEKVSEVLLEKYSSRELWFQPTLPMELHQYVQALVEHGELFVRFRLDRADAQSEATLLATEWLAPETIVRRRRGGQDVYEQYASKRALTGEGYVVSGEPTEFLAEFPAEEVLTLRWPFSEPAGRGSPAQIALRVGREVGLHAERGLLTMRASVEDDSFLPLARGRAGAYVGALDQQKTLSARVKDMLFYPGAQEAEIWPWVEEVTDYFMADRIIRSRIAICQLRDYLFGEFNRQVLDRWGRINEWAPVRLGLRPVLFEESDWHELRAGLDDGSVSLEDVRAAVTAEWDAGHYFSRWERQRREAASG